MQKGRGIPPVSHIGCALLLAAVTLGVYGASLRNGFVEWDDGYLITENQHIRSITPLTLRHIFQTYDPELYIPLTFLSYQLDHLIWGLNPMGFHLMNLLLHAANSVLVFFLIQILLQNFHFPMFNFPTLAKATSPTWPFWRAAGRQGTSSPSPELRSVRGVASQQGTWIAFTIALLWVVHPLNTEAVAWASARKDVLSGFFFLSSLLLYLTWRVDRLLRTFWWSILLFFLGLLAKVTVATLPILLLLIDWWQGRSINRRTIGEKMPYLLLSFIFGIIAIMGKTRNVASTSLLESLLLGTKSTIFSLQKLLIPAHLSTLYPYTDTVSFGNPDLLFPFFLTIGLLTLAWIARRRFPLFTFAIAWYILLLAPSFTAFRKGDDIELDLYFASDRYAYLPSIGLLFFLGALGTHFCSRARTHSDEQRRRLTLMSGTAAIATVFSLLANVQSRTWQDTETLFRNVLRSFPNAHIAHNNIGLFEQGRGNTSAAIAHYERAIAIKPTGRTYYNLGLAYIARGEKAKALEANRTAVSLNPRHARAFLNLGGLLLEEEKIPEATANLEQAIAIDPRLTFAHFNLGLAFERQGRMDAAMAAYEAALDQDPNDIETLVSLAALYVREREPESALTLLQHAIALQSHHPRYEPLLLEIARLQGKSG